MFLIGDEVVFATANYAINQPVYKVTQFDSATITVELNGNYYTLSWGEADDLGIQQRGGQMAKFVKMNLRIYGILDDSDKDAQDAAKKIVQGALSDAGWSSVDVEKQAPAWEYPVELNGVTHPMPAPIPVMESRGTIPPCGYVSPSGHFKCTLHRGHSLNQHVASGETRTLAIWD